MHAGDYPRKLPASPDLLGAAGSPKRLFFTGYFLPHVKLHSFIPFIRAPVFASFP
jgi:hypothetical protein